MKIKLISLALTLGMSQGVFATEGVAFIHGTGQQSDAYNDYWTSGFVDKVRQGIANPNNFTVINCDFEQFMWAEGAAGCLADSLNGFITNKNITDLTLITHSNGGNVVRWILSNPTWDSRYPSIINKINHTIALAPSSGGTPLADAVIAGNTFEQGLGWILGYGNDAVKQQQVSWMAAYNAEWLKGTPNRPTLPSRFETVIGSDVESAVWDSDSYCGGYQNQVGLEVTQNWLDDCSDGFLECSSQALAGSVWFTDKSRTRGREPLSHQQSRRDCFGLGDMLKNRI
ncbi:hypothetical protein [Pseudoalteromonas ruthenica]|uniref:hypothetical protein n=1 Tax=Pseudoalteromonas ruthenica TaxID=151081 RepID=UPI00110B2EB5|nr:hypothetical protein [Pseudoalteromonas ruthenica]TMO44300.1 hypothetical protein CWC24_14330 [Pseudoalteromonas ruthenica]TMO51497.1 hypothetical protein CWC23_06090 [Pseudoalteromonas ruthenica]